MFEVIMEQGIQTLKRKTKSPMEKIETSAFQTVKVKTNVGEN